MDAKMEEQRSDVAQGKGGGVAMQVSPSVIGWGVASVAFTIFAIAVNVSPAVLGAGLLAKIFAGVVGSVFGLAGALLGNAFRNFARPDAVFTNGGVASLVWIKIFWAIGPQVIGLVIGSAFGVGLIVN